MKIVSKGRALHSQAFYEKKKKRKRIKIILFFILLFLFVGLIVAILRHDKFQVSKITLIGGQVTDEEDISNSAKALMAGTYLGVIPKSNTLIYPKEKILAGLTKEFPRFESIEAELKGLQNLVVTVKERSPFAIYCDRFVSPSDISGCYFLDKDGYIFASAPSFSEGVYFIYTTKKPLENPIGQSLMNRDEFKAIPTFIEELRSIGINPEMIEIDEKDYSLVLPKGAKILWKRSDDLALVKANLEAFLESDPIKKDKNFFDRLLHIDLRTDNKVFYKFKD